MRASESSARNILPLPVDTCPRANPKNSARRRCGLLQFPWRLCPDHGELGKNASAPFLGSFRVADDPEVGGRDQKDVWRMAKFFSLASAMTRGALPAFLFVIPSLSRCEVFRGAKCMEQLRCERADSR